MKHLLSIEDLERADIERIMDRAASFAEVGRRDIKKVPTLRGRTIVSLFYESSTRTSSSFELAAKRLSADVVSIKAPGSSVDKGESLKDTIATLSAYAPEAIMIRFPYAGAARLVTDWTAAAVVNAGDGKHEHPSQALLDTYTLLERLGRPRGQADLDRRRRPAQPRRPLLRALLPDARRRGHALRAADPDPARGRGGARRRRRLRPRRPRRGRRGLRAADAARADDGDLRALDARVRRPTTRSTRAGSARASCSCIPGRSTAGSSSPPEVIDGPASLITAQVESGLVVRMAVLYELLAGGEPRGAADHPTPSCPPRPRSESRREL